MKFFTFCLSLICFTTLSAQIKPHLNQIPRNTQSKHQADDVELKTDFLQGLPKKENSSLVPPNFDFTQINALPKSSAVGSFLKVTKDLNTTTPIFMGGKLEYQSRSFDGKSVVEQECLSYLDALKHQLQIDEVDQSFELKTQHTDSRGQTHARFQQYHLGIPIYGAEAMLHMKNGKVEKYNGRTFPQAQITSVNPSINENTAVQMVTADLSQTVAIKDLQGQSLALVGGQQVKAELVIYYKEKDVEQEHLAWYIEYAPNLVSRWAYFIDAENGTILHKHTQLCQFHGSACSGEAHNMPPDGPAVANAQDLFGINRTINTYEKNNVFFMIDASRQMHNESLSSFPDEPVGVIWTIDAENTSPQNDNFSTVHITSGNNSWNNPTAVSAHYNAGEAYEYFRTTFGRNSINGQGGNIISLINVRDENNQDMDNAFWNGFAMFYGNGDQAFVNPLAKALDVAAHELSHGVIQNTANLEYFGESGALNESFADIFAAMVDRNDWRLGEDIVNTNIFTSGALRDLSNPNNGGTSLNSPGWQPESVSQQFMGSEDNGGVHINSGITNRAFFLFASQVGKETAEQVFYEALTNYLLRTSQFIDLRIAVIEASQDMYGSTVANAAASAFTEVGIGAGQGTDPQEDVQVNPGEEFILYSDANLSDLKIYTPDEIEVADPLTNEGPLSKPSITDDGRFIVYIAQDKTMRIIDIDWTAGSFETDFLSTDPVWRNVAISKDGNKIAALTDDFDNRLFIFDLTTNPATSQVFELYNPTFAEGVETGDVQYADVLEWDFSGEFVMYDALNTINNTSSTIDYWDIGFIQVWDEATDNFANGLISKLFSGLPEGSSVGNPTFSKKSPFIIGLDLIDSFNEEYYIMGANIETGEVGTIFQNSRLGYPNYSVADNQMIFDASSQFGDEVIGIIGLTSDKINGTGQATVLFSDFSGAKWGTWFANGERDLTSVEELTQSGLSFAFAPNPFKDQLNLSLDFEEAGEIQIEVLDVLGKVHFLTQEEFFAGKQNLELNLQGLEAGTYFIRVMKEGISGTKKLIKLN